MWSCLPSSILGVKEPFAAYSINQAVWSFGSALSTALEEASAKEKNDEKRKRKRMQVLAKWLPDVKADTSRHRDPGQESPDAIIKRA